MFSSSDKQFDRTSLSYNQCVHLLKSYLIGQPQLFGYESLSGSGLCYLLRPPLAPVWELLGGGRPKARGSTVAGCAIYCVPRWHNVAPLQRTRAPSTMTPDKSR